jgi:hypothetical protein
VRREGGPVGVPFRVYSLQEGENEPWNHKRYPNEVHLMIEDGLYSEAKFVHLLFFWLNGSYFSKSHTYWAPALQQGLRMKYREQ